MSRPRPDRENGNGQDRPQAALIRLSSVFESATPVKAGPARAAADATKGLDRGGALEKWHPSDESTQEAVMLRPQPQDQARLHSAGDGATEGTPVASYVAGLCPTPAF